MRVKEFEIWNTESRAQLFSHSFGYRQVAFDFGVDFEPQALDRKTEQNWSFLHGENRNKAPSYDQQFSMTDPTQAEPFSGNEKLIIRQFVVVRLRSTHSAVRLTTSQNRDDDNDND